MPTRCTRCRSPRVVCLLAAAPLFLTGAASAQPCPDPWAGDYYWTRTFPPPGVDGDVLCSVVHQGDLYVGGAFAAIGDQPIAGVTRWDGSAWQPVGAGGPTFVQALAGHGSDLYAAAGGYFSVDVFRWDGTSWSALPSITASGSPIVVEALASYGGDLYLAGTFLAFLPGNNTRGVLRWDGAAWSFAGKVPSGVRDLVTHDGLLVAGFYGSAIDSVVAQSVAAYDGSSWQPVGTGLPGAPAALTVYQGDLVAAGSPNGMGGYTVNRWDGAAWSVMETLSGAVLDAAGDPAGLVVSGAFTAPGNRIARYDGSQWSAMGSGPDLDVFSLTWFNGDLVAGGEFGVMGGVPARRVAIWGGAAWAPMGDESGWGLDGAVYALASRGGDLIAGGSFTVKRDPTIQNLARWDGAAWHSLGEVNGIVFALSEFNGSLAVGGTIWSIDGVSMSGKLPLWNGTTWSGLGSNLGGTVYALQVWNGELYAGGTINSYSSTPDPRYVARWNGATWQKLGAGFDYIDSPYRHVRALGVWNGMLIVGGGFPGVDDVVGPLAAWTGADWVPLGSLLNQFDFTVLDIASYGGELVIAGDFCESGGKCRIARFDGTTWSDVGGGLLGEYAYALEVVGDLLYVAGSPDDYDVTHLEDGIAAWDGACWLRLGSGLGSPDLYAVGNALALHEGSLYAGGSFGTAGGKLSQGLAGWADPVALGAPDVRPAAPGLALDAAVPNPMGSGMSARFVLDRPARVEAGVFAVDGRRVAALLEATLDAGPHVVRWSGRDDRGRPVGDGVYFLRVAAGGRATTQRVVVRR